MVEFFWNFMNYFPLSELVMSQLLKLTMGLANWAELLTLISYNMQQIKPVLNLIIG